MKAKPFLRSWSVWLGVAALALNTGAMLRAVEVTGAEASRSNAAAFWGCFGAAPCGVACVPPTCGLNGQGCAATVAGVNGMSRPAAIVGACGFSSNPFMTCPPFAPCGVNVIAGACPAFVAGGCPPAACAAGAPVPAAC